MRAVFDTNVYISAFITPGGKAEEAYLLTVEKKIELYTSIPILTETAGKLKEKFLWSDEQITATIKHIGTVSTVVKPKNRITVLIDEPDNRILECAEHSKADFLVTGDRHLLDLKKYGQTRIIKLAEFLGKIR
ncbi:MAG: putative toxin-antitoxin system toxin component, PIN family [Nitrospirae bacterium]|nr:putative toxin-antitoxin system toxin component, PIN family [Nitrospirota bacterium]